MAEVVRKAFMLRLKPGALDEYVNWHRNIWPELKAEIAAQGIAEVTLWHLDDLVFLHSEVTDPEAWTRLWDSEVHRRWAGVMDPLMYYRPDGVVDSHEMSEIWHAVPGSEDW